MLLSNYTVENSLVRWCLSGLEILPLATHRNLTTWLYDDMYVNLKRKRKSSRFLHFVLFKLPLYLKGFTFLIYIINILCEVSPWAIIDIEKIWDISLETTKVMVGLKKAVDSFHFKGHTDKKCQDNYNPEKLKKELGVDCLNTPVCEKSFMWLIKG